MDSEKKTIKNVIIDTDIGSDVDDAIALVYAIKAGMDIKLITTVHGVVEQRAKIAKKITLMLGKNIPVAYGEAKPLKQKTIYNTGFEGKEFVDNGNFDIMNNAVDFFAETVYAHKHDITVAAIGALTNVAKAFKKYPDLPQYINHLYIMGGAKIKGERVKPDYTSHNFKVDPEAADIVLAADMPITIVTKQVSKKNYFTREQFNTLSKNGDPVMQYLRHAAKQWLDFSGKKVAYLYDPLTLFHVIDEGITTKEKIGNFSITTDVDKIFKQRLISVLESGHSD